MSRRSRRDEINLDAAKKTMMYTQPEGMLKEWCDRDYPNAQKKPHEAECIERKWNNTEISADKNYRRRTRSYNVFNNREE